MLTEQEKRDLIGLASGLGTAEATSRAQWLESQSAEAGAYLKDIEALGTLLEAPPPSGLVDLEPDVTERIASGAYARWKRRRVRRAIVPMGIAAAVVFGFLGLQARHQAMPAPWAKAFIMPAEPAAGLAPLLIERSIGKGESISTAPDQTAIVRLERGAALVLSTGTSAVVLDGSVRLHSGTAVFTAQSPARVSAGEVEADLTAGELIIKTDAATVDISAYSGTVTLKAHAQAVTLSAGQRAVWAVESQRFQTMQGLAPYPREAKQALERVAAVRQ